MHQRRSDFSHALEKLLHDRYIDRKFGANLNYNDLRADCHNMLRTDVAYVSVKMSGTVYTKNVRNIRMSFEDKLASFGTIKHTSMIQG